MGAFLFSGVNYLYARRLVTKNNLWKNKRKYSKVKLSMRYN